MSRSRQEFRLEALLSASTRDRRSASAFLGRVPRAKPIKGSGYLSSQPRVAVSQPHPESGARPNTRAGLRPLKDTLSPVRPLSCAARIQGGLPGSEISGEPRNVMRSMLIGHEGSSVMLTFSRGSVDGSKAEEVLGQFDVRLPQVHETENLLSPLSPLDSPVRSPEFWARVDAERRALSEELGQDFIAMDMESNSVSIECGVFPRRSAGHPGEAEFQEHNLTTQKLQTSDEGESQGHNSSVKTVKLSAHDWQSVCLQDENLFENLQEEQQPQEPISARALPRANEDVPLMPVLISESIADSVTKAKPAAKAATFSTQNPKIPEPPSDIPDFQQKAGLDENKSEISRQPRLKLRDQDNGVLEQSSRQTISPSASPVHSSTVPARRGSSSIGSVRSRSSSPVKEPSGKSVQSVKLAPLANVGGKERRKQEESSHDKRHAQDIEEIARLKRELEASAKIQKQSEDKISNLDVLLKRTKLELAEVQDELERNRNVLVRTHKVTGDGSQEIMELRADIDRLIAKNASDAATISSLQGKLEAEHSANKLLHEEASILREHAANLQQSDNVRKHEVGADDDVSDSVKSCAECNNLKKQLADTQKMLHATKVQLATLLATNSAVSVAKMAGKVPRSESADSVVNSKLTSEQGARIQDLEEAVADAQVKIASLSHENQTLLATLTKQVGSEVITTESFAIQTDPPPVDCRTKWLWLLATRIQMLANKVNVEGAAIGQDALAPVTTLHKEVQCVEPVQDAFTMTLMIPETKTISDETLWWSGVVEKVDDALLKHPHTEYKGEGGGTAGLKGDARFAYWLSDKKVLDTINAVYQEKVVADYLHRERGSHEPYHSLPSFLFAFLIYEYGDKHQGDLALRQFVGSLLRRVRLHPQRTDQRMLPSARHRMVLFARFLGFEVLGEDGAARPPIGNECLEVYLMMLAASRQGQCPLLEPGMKEMKADREVLIKIVETVFASEESWEREALKTHINDAFDTVAENDDVESILEKLLRAWHKIQLRWNSRLESLFVAHDTDGSGEMDMQEFTRMLQKIVDGDKLMQDLLMHRRMYADMCMWPCVDASVFSKVARDYSFEALHVTHSMDTEVTSNPSTTMKQLIPLLQAAMISVQQNAEILSTHPAYLDMMFSWSLCQRLCNEGKATHLAYLSFHLAMAKHHRIQVHFKEQGVSFNSQG